MRKLSVLVVVLVALGGAVAAGAWVVSQRLTSPWRAWEGDHVDVVVEEGMSASRAAERLAEAGVLRDARLLVWWLWWTDRTSGIHAGEYRFQEARSVLEIADILASGRVRLLPVTIPEGSTRWQVARALASAGFGDYEGALRATEAVELVADLDPEATTLEGYLYPETYMAPVSHGAEDLVRAMVQRFRRIWTEERQARARELGLGVREAVILASIVEAETPAAEERPVVSAVFHNRLEGGMLLQTDPTVLYAMRVAGREDRNIRRSDLSMDSPYNTYVVSGLPAGPIGNPRAASIDAALNPADVDYLYFVSRNDGTHVFSRTLTEHNRNVDRYQRNR